MKSLDPFLAASDKFCKALAKQHYENFLVATSIVGPELKKHLYRIYAFCRFTDDLGDEFNSSPRLLNDWKQQTYQALVDDMETSHPILVVLKDTVSKFAIPPTLFLDIIHANELDQQKHKYSSFPELLEYCRYSANPVGRMVLYLFRAVNDITLKYSDDICTGLQIANFVQDVSVDRTKGRCYLPLDMLEQYGESGTIRELSNRAQELLEQSWPIEAMVPFSLAVQLSLYRLGGLAIIAEVRKLNFDTSNLRPSVSLAKKAVIALTAIKRTVWSKRTWHTSQRVAT